MDIFILIQHIKNNLLIFCNQYNYS